MSTTGWRVGTSVDVAAELLERRDRVARPLGRPALALEHEAAHRLVDRGEVAVEQLLGVVRLRGDEAALAELQHRLLRGRPVAARAGDEPALVLGDRQRARRERVLAPRPGATRRPRRGARRAPRRRRCSSPCGTSSPRRSGVATTTSSQLRASGLSGFAGHEPALARRTRRTASSVSGVVALVADRDEHVAPRGWSSTSLERLHRPPAGLRGVERGAAAGEETSARREPPVRRHLRSHSGCASTPRGSAPAATVRSIPSRPWSGFRFVHRETGALPRPRRAAATSTTPST